MSVVSPAPDVRLEDVEHPFGPPHASPVPGNLIALFLALACLVAGWLALSAVFGDQGRYLEGLAKYQAQNSGEWVFVEKSGGEAIVHAAIPEKMVELIPGVDPSDVSEGQVLLARFSYPAAERTEDGMQNLLARADEDRLSLMAGRIPENFQALEVSGRNQVLASVIAQTGPMGLRPTSIDGLAMLFLLLSFFMMFAVVARHRPVGVFCMSLAAAGFVALSIVTMAFVWSTSSGPTGLGDVGRMEIVAAPATIEKKRS